MSTTQVIDALPIAPLAKTIGPVEEDTGDVPGMFELVLRGKRRLDTLLRDESALPSVIQRLLLLSLLGLLVHGLVVGMSVQLVGADAGSFYSRGTPWLWMPLSFAFAFIGSLCICLPSFYFYTQLSGLDASFRLVTAQALRAQATTSVLLLGVLPFYAAWILGNVIGIFRSVDIAVFIGMCLPFLVGLFGIQSIYASFGRLVEFLPITHQRRGNFLRRMVLCWGAVYSIVAPVALYRLVDALAGRI